MEETLMLHIGAITGRQFHIEASPRDTVLDVKLKIFRESNLPPEAQVLLYGEKTLSNDHQTLEHHAIGDGARLSLVLHMHGGQIIYQEGPISISFLNLLFFRPWPVVKNQTARTGCS